MNHWGAVGPMYYVLARLHWQPDALVDTVLTEYYGTFSGQSICDIFLCIESVCVYPCIYRLYIVRRIYKFYIQISHTYCRRSRQLRRRWTADASVSRVDRALDIRDLHVGGRPVSLSLSLCLCLCLCLSLSLAMTLMVSIIAVATVTVLFSTHTR